MNINDPTLISVSKTLNINPQWLFNLIKFESNWNPLAKASYPYNKKDVDSGIDTPRYARGLIQFIDSTAFDLGYPTADDLVDTFPTVESQLLTPVLDYLSKYMPFKNEQSLYLSVFYPAARNWSPTKQFPDSVKIANPGINTPQDYINYVKGVKGGDENVNLLIYGSLFLTGVFMLFKYVNKKRKL